MLLLRVNTLITRSAGTPVRLTFEEKRHMADSTSDPLVSFEGDLDKMSSQPGEQMDEKRKSDQAGICARHSQTLNMFCSQDEETICHSCWESDHTDHPIKPLRRAREDLEREAASALDLLREELGQVESLRARQNEVTTSNRLRNIKLRAKIGSQFEELREELRQKEELAMMEIDWLNKEAQTTLAAFDRVLFEGREREAALQASLDITGFEDFLRWWKEAGCGHKKTRSSLTGCCPGLSPLLPQYQSSLYSFSSTLGNQAESSESLLNFVNFVGIEKNIRMTINPQSQNTLIQEGFHFTQVFGQSNTGFGAPSFTGFSFGN
ncbi:uncharacterized protein LOC130118023 [Lampris incognitus]|uniref:uncharacterized protein LOC130118023 n=1 Tax=Lampris incognitus TaxID=2546036 RepID=UPI0024B60457|nr:uncharacterized protein LOC130118023 [Lampris incognitus]